MNKIRNLDLRRPPYNGTSPGELVIDWDWPAFPRKLALRIGLTEPSATPREVAVKIHADVTNAIAGMKAIQELLKILEAPDSWWHRFLRRVAGVR